MSTCKVSGHCCFGRPPVPPFSTHEVKVHDADAVFQHRPWPCHRATRSLSAVGATLNFRVLCFREWCGLVKAAVHRKYRASIAASTRPAFITAHRCIHSHMSSSQPSDATADPNYLSTGMREGLAPLTLKKPDYLSSVTSYGVFLTFSLNRCPLGINHDLVNDHYIAIIKQRPKDWLPKIRVISSDDERKQCRERRPLMYPDSYENSIYVPSPSGTGLFLPSTLRYMHPKISQGPFLVTGPLTMSVCFRTTMAKDGA